MKFKRMVIPVILVIALLVTTFLLPPIKNREDEIKSIRRTDISPAKWYSTERFDGGQQLSGFEKPVLLKVGESVTVKADTLAGAKNIILNYKPSNPKIADCIVKLKVDNQNFDELILRYKKTNLLSIQAMMEVENIASNFESLKHSI